jgi:hypothetical protein
MLPLQGPANLAGFKVLNITDLGLATSLASGGSSNGASFFVGQPASVYMLATVASGQQVLRAKTGSTSTIDLTSGATTQTVVGAGDKGYVKVDTDATSNAYAKVGLLDSNWSSALSSIDVFVLVGPNVNTQAYSIHNPLQFGTAVDSAVGQ